MSPPGQHWFLPCGGCRAKVLGTRKLAGSWLFRHVHRLVLKYTGQEVGVSPSAVTAQGCLCSGGWPGVMKTHAQTVSRPTPPSVVQQLDVLGPESEGLRALVSPSMTQNPTYPATVKRAMTNAPALGLTTSFLVPSLLHLISFGIALWLTASRKQLARSQTPPLGPTPKFPAWQRVSRGRWVGLVV